jgi:hypothetical protein
MAKLYIKVTDDFDRKFTKWAKRLGLTKSQLGNICMQSGLQHIIQAVSPVEAFSPTHLAAIAELANKRKTGEIQADMFEEQLERIVSYEEQKES